MMRLKSLIDILDSRRDDTDYRLNFYRHYSLIESMTYEDIWRGSSAFAEKIIALKSQSEIVLLSLDTGPQFVMAFVGSLMAGKVPCALCPHDLMFKKDYLDLVKSAFSKTKSDILICEKIMTEMGSEVRQIQVDSLGTKDPTDPEFTPLIGEDCFVQFSSGSTRDPEGVVLSHDNVLYNLKQISSSLKLTSHDIVCSWLPLHHDMGLVGVLLGSLYNAVTAHLMPAKDFIVAPQKWLELVSETSASIIVAPDSAYQNCVKKVPSEEKIDLSSVRLALCGAEPVSHEHLENFIQRFEKIGFDRKAFLPVYGLAEATLAVSFPHLDKNITVKKFDWKSINRDHFVSGPSNSSSRPVALVSCGQALAGTDLKILLSDQSPADDGQVGSVWVRSPSVSKKTVSGRSLVDHEGWLATGDLGFFYQGELFICGRQKDMIVVGGRNLSPHSLEEKLSGLDEIKWGRLACFSYLDPEGREKVSVAAECCLLSSKERLALKKTIKQSLFGLVKLETDDVLLLPPLSLKKSTSGKIKRYKTKEMFLDGELSNIEKNFKLFFWRRYPLIQWFKLRILMGHFFKFKKSPSIEHKKLNLKIVS